MLKIRLQRTGRKHEPTFRLVLTESTNSTKSGKFLDILGSYDSRTDKPQLNGEKIKEWMGKGATVTDTVHNMLINEKIISGKKINVLPRKSPPKPVPTEASGKEEVVAAEGSAGTPEAAPAASESQTEEASAIETTESTEAKA